MDFRRNTRILIAFAVFLVISGTQGQQDDFIKICDLCNMEGLIDCNSTNIFHINMTVNCEITNKMCTLGINESFEGFENITMHDIDQEHICISKEMSKDGAIKPADNEVSVKSIVQMSTTTNENNDIEQIVTSSFDVAPEETLFLREEPLVPSTTIFTESNANLEVVEETSSLRPNEFGEDESLTAVTDIAFSNESTVSQLNEQMDLLRTANDSSEDELANSNPGSSHADEIVSCFACDSSTNEACLGRIDELKAINCPKASGCISYYSNGNVIRNCGSIVSPKQLELCHKPNNSSCHFCSSNNCNTKPWKECFQCNSKVDPNCALWSNAETVPFAICPNYNDDCLIRITADGDTLRECSVSNAKCSQDELCSFCEGPLCNSGVFPENRLQCIQCEECEDAQDPITALPCLHYNASEECFLYVTAKSRMIRGCVSNAMDMQECQHNEPKCITCGGQNGCNSLPLMKEPTLSCSKCKSKESPQCEWYQSETSVTKCVNKFLYYLTETCLMEFDLSSQTAVRDCSFDYGVCTPEDHDCHSCSENGCNRENLKFQHCVQCQSDQPEQIECRNQAKGILASRCPQEKQWFETRGCFTMTKGNITTRGCFASLSADDSKICKKEGQSSCHVCMLDGCNNDLAPSVAGETAHISSFIFLALFLLAF